MLHEQEILGPNDVVRCSADELHERCSIPIGTAKLIVAEGVWVTQEVKSEARACKRQK